jgi:hypothetical protein
MKSLRMFDEKMKVPLFNRSDYPEVQAYESLINRTVTQRTADYIVSQMNLSFEVETRINQLDEGKYEIESEGHRNAETTIDNCSCSRYTNKLLPCFHIISLRNHLELALFEQSMISSQFRKENYTLLPLSKTAVTLSQMVVNRRPYTPISSEKFNAIRIETDKLASVISKSGVSLNTDQLNIVKELTEAFANKLKIKIIPISDSSSEEMVEEVEPPKSSESEKSDESIKSDISDISDLNIRPQFREKFVGRPSVSTAIGKTRKRPKPSQRLIKDRHLSITSLEPKTSDAHTSLPVAKVNIVSNLKLVYSTFVSISDFITEITRKYCD